ncbi:MAG: helical backbone metal receptor [Treponema sp.]|nr:helical backbone metal receptor [Treponema sp.]
MKRPVFPILIFFLLISFFFSGCRKEAVPSASAPSGPAPITDALGRPFTPGPQPQRIISLVPAMTEILFAIGAGDALVGRTEYCDYPEEAHLVPSVGGFAGATMSLEMIRFLEPDLVFLSAQMHERIVALLDQLGISSFAVEPAKLSEVYQTIELTGLLTGCQEGAALLVSRMEAQIAGVQSLVQGRPAPGVFWILSADPLMSAGRSTFISEAIHLAGGRNIFDDVNEDWPLISPEQVIMRRPDWVLMGDDVGTSIESFEANPLWRSLPALSQGQVRMIDAGAFYRYGPRLAQAVEDLAQILHGQR